MGKSSTVQFPTGKPKVSRNGRSRQGYTDEADARYAAAFKLVQAIDHNLRNGTQHYYDNQGRLLRTLDEVINAVLTDNLAPSKPDKYPQEAEAVQWVPINELVA
jgi:hypothetical protein